MDVCLWIYTSVGVLGVSDFQLGLSCHHLAFHPCTHTIPENSSLTSVHFSRTFMLFYVHLPARPMFLWPDYAIDARKPLLHGPLRALFTLRLPFTCKHFEMVISHKKHLICWEIKWNLHWEDLWRRFVMKSSHMSRLAEIALQSEDELHINDKARKLFTGFYVPYCSDIVTTGSSFSFDGDKL